MYVYVYIIPEILNFSLVHAQYVHETVDLHLSGAGPKSVYLNVRVLYLYTSDRAIQVYVARLSNRLARLFCSKLPGNDTTQGCSH